MLKNIIVIEHEGAETRAMSLAFDVPDPQFDIEAAVKAASTDYCKTEAGKVVYKHNCRCFNWADFEGNIPDYICEKYGFKLVRGECAEAVIVDWNEQLTNDSEIRRSEYMDAVDVVCLECNYAAPSICDKCPVRNTVDNLNGKEV